MGSSVPSRLERHTGEDCRAGLGLRVNRQFPADEIQAFLHADEAETAPFHRVCGIKTSPEITHRQKELIQSTFERYLDAP